MGTRIVSGCDRGTRRTSRAIFRSLAFLILVLASPTPLLAADFALNATVTDSDDRRMAGVKVVLGRIEVKDTQTTVRPEQTGVTDAMGRVTLRLTSTQATLGAAVVEQPAGRVAVPSDGILRLRAGTTEGAFTLISAPDATEAVPGGDVTTEGFFGATGRDTYPALERRAFAVEAGSLKLWRAVGPRQGPPVLLIQGFSLVNERVEGYEVYKAFFDLAQGLRRRGRDVWVLTFATVRGPVAGAALSVSQALEFLLQPARGYGKLDVVGHSLGGLAGRWALAQDEQRGGLSKGRVRVFASVDAPHQGMNVLPAGQAALQMFAADMMRSPAVQNMLFQWVGPTNFDTDTCRFPQESSIRTTPAAHDAFYRALNTLNGDGYPRLCRNVAVAGGNMTARAQKVGDRIYRVTASLGFIRLCRQEYDARALDVLPGAVFPGQLLPTELDVDSVNVDFETFMDPTLVPTASAIDWRDGASKFERFFLPSLPAGSVLRHGDPIPGATEFLLWQLTDLAATTFAVTPAPPPSGWHRAPVTVALRATSPYNDATTSEYSRNGGMTWTPYTNPIEIRDDGIHRILARSRVAAGNLEDPAAETTIRLDATPPVITITALESQSVRARDRDLASVPPRALSVTAADALSGIAPGTLTVLLDGRRVEAGRIPLTGLAPGLHTVTATAQDGAGNVGTASQWFVVKPPRDG